MADHTVCWQNTAQRHLQDASTHNKMPKMVVLGLQDYPNNNSIETKPNNSVFLKDRIQKSSNYLLEDFNWDYKMELFLTQHIQFYSTAILLKF